MDSNQEAVNLADRKELQGAEQKERLLWAEGNGNKQVTQGKKSGLVIAKLLFFRAWQGSVRQMT